MKSDAVIRVHRQTWEAAKRFAKRHNRQLREVVGVALDEYITREASVKLPPAAKPKSLFPRLGE